MCIIDGEGVTNPEKGGREYIVRVGNNQKYSSVSGIISRVVHRVYVCPAFLGIANSLPKHLSQFMFPPAMSESFDYLLKLVILIKNIVVFTCIYTLLIFG